MGLSPTESGAPDFTQNRPPDLAHLGEPPGVVLEGEFAQGQS